MKAKSFIFWAAVAVLVLSTSSCTTNLSYRSPGNKIGHGPPPHAPAHGYRRKFPSKVELVFDSECGVYVVVGLDDHFWLDGWYYRFYNGQWALSMSIESGWKVIGEEDLPPGLRNKYKIPLVSKKHPGRGWGHGKNKW